ncbi:MAG: hypothetical protein ACI8RZ_006759 [Myxococcota bacterium]|jgi:hypothetical protein
MTLSLRSALISAGLLLSLPALALDWEWGDEVANREWNQASLSWAEGSHPNHPSQILLLTTTAPPPREMWCTDNSAPTETDCDIFDTLLEDWTQDFLGIPDPGYAPNAVLIAFPSECNSICS